MRIAVGLGNPESKYDGTYHNTGFLVADLVAQRLGLKFKKLDCRAWTAVKLRGGEGILLAKPTTYMNLSGESVKGLAVKYKVLPQELLVVYDDLDLDLGEVRIRQSGGPGTHNGMRNIVACLGREDFPRVRVGIGRPQAGADVAAYVLSRVPKESREPYLAACARAAEAVAEFLGGTAIDLVMNRYNGK